LSSFAFKLCKELTAEVIGDWTNVWLKELSGLKGMACLIGKGAIGLKELNEVNGWLQGMSGLKGKAWLKGKGSSGLKGLNGLKGDIG